ncbi:MAG: cytochrome c-type biogenesis protein CcmH [Halioglobus sp.]|nr:cytochrome c-type biogenesis protein CcmH [Halioglobus sp.]
MNASLRAPLRISLHRLVFAWLALWSLQCAAVIETYEFSDPALEERYQLLSAELRCPKCQNQNIADSNAPIARDLRRLLYEQLEAGASDDAILDHMVARYGEFVRYRPRFAGATAILWLAPVILLLAGVAILAMTLRSRTSRGSDTALSDAERARLQALLTEKEGSG